MIPTYNEWRSCWTPTPELIADYQHRYGKDWEEQLEKALRLDYDSWCADVSKEISLSKYLEFVDGVTSTHSKDTEEWIYRIRELEEQGCSVARLSTAGIGMADEAGEFAGLVKKILFHGKPYDVENRKHLEKELGDVIWYWAQACIALGVNPEEVINQNVRKLESRYPGGKFSIHRSEVREEGDV